MVEGTYIQFLCASVAKCHEQSSVANFLNIHHNNLLTQRNPSNLSVSHTGSQLNFGEKFFNVTNRIRGEERGGVN